MLPVAVAWAADQESVILRSGVPLTESQVAYARQLGVLFPERVRLLRVTQIPTPTHPILLTTAAATRDFVQPLDTGGCFRQRFGR